MPFGKRQKKQIFCIPDTYLLDAVLFFIILTLLQSANYDSKNGITIIAALTNKR